MVVLWLTIGVFSVVVQDLFVSSLNVTRVVSFLNESASINISFSPREQSLTLWDVNYGQKQSMVTCFGDPCKCNVTGFLSKADVFTLTCSSSYVKVTVKHLSLKQHGEQWRYSSVPENNDYVAILCANVGNNSLTANQTQGDVGTDTFTFNENDLVFFQCRTSFCEPYTTVSLLLNQTAEKNIYLSTKNQSHVNDNDYLHINATFEVAVNRTFNKWTVRCTANSIWTIEPVGFSRLYSLNIQYLPDGPPTIQSFSNGSVYKIIEHKEGFLMCSVDAPENITVNSISPPFNNIHVIDNTTLKLFCSAVANPSPYNYSWSGLFRSDTSELQLYINKSSIGNITCSVTNVMMETYGKYETTIGMKNETFVLDVLYPPTIKSLSNISIIEGKSIFVFCVVISGNPSFPTDIRWIHNKNTQYSSVLHISIVNKTDIGRHTCVANNTMVPTYGERQTGIDEQCFYLHVLYPPEEIHISSTSLPNHDVFNSITIIENTFLKLFCSARSNPEPSFFAGYGLNTSNTSEVYIHGSKSTQGNITCVVENVMIELPGNMITYGMSSKTMHVEVLYPPEIIVNWTQIVIEGYNINISCTVSPGRTSQQSIGWMKNQENITANNSLTIENVTRKHSGNYTCILNYTMIPTYGETKTEVLARGIYIDVIYQPEISKFFAADIEHNMDVTVNESDNVHMVCVVDSNPKSTIQISFANNTIISQENTTTLEHVIYRVRCTDTGNYVCSAYNSLNANGPLSSRNLHLLVNCSPRLSPNVEIQQNITTSQQGSAILSFVVMAFPSPHIKWFRKTNSTILEANNGFTTVQTISENEMLILFIVTNVALTDFGEYVLTINNTHGLYQQSYFLLESDQVNVGTHASEVMSVGFTTGIAAGSVIATLMIVAVVYIIYKRLRGKPHNQLNNSRENRDVPQYQNISTDGIGISTDNVSCSPNVYEGLQAMGSDQQYLEL